MHDYLPMHHGDDLIGCSNFRTQCSIDDLEIQETGDGYFSLYIKKDNQAVQDDNNLSIPLRPLYQKQHYVQRLNDFFENMVGQFARLLGISAHCVRLLDGFREFGHFARKRSLRLYQCIEFINDLAIFYHDQRKRTSTIRLMIGSFKIHGNKIHFCKTSLGNYCNILLKKANKFNKKHRIFYVIFVEKSQFLNSFLQDLELDGDHDFSVLSQIYAKL